MVIGVTRLGVAERSNGFQVMAKEGQDVGVEEASTVRNFTARQTGWPRDMDMVVSTVSQDLDS